MRHTTHPPPPGPPEFVERRRNHGVPDHEHTLPRSLQVLVLISFVGLLVSIGLVYVQTQETNARLDRLEQFVAGRGEFRDQEAARQEEQFNRFVCQLLDQSPVTPELDRIRVQYDCGPGLLPAD